MIYEKKRNLDLNGKNTAESKIINWQLFQNVLLYLCLFYRWGESDYLPDRHTFKQLKPEKSAKIVKSASINLKSLSIRVIGGLIIVVMVAVGTSFTFQYMNDRRRGLEAFRDESAVAGELIRMGLAKGMLRNDFQTLRETAANLENRPDVDMISGRSKGRTEC